MEPLINFYPNAYEPSTVEGVEGNFSYSVVKKAGLPHYDQDGNTFKPILLTALQLENLLRLREEESTFQRRYADAKQVDILGWEILTDPHYGPGSKLQINLKIEGKAISIYSRDLAQTLGRAIYGLEYMSLSFATIGIDDYQAQMAIQAAFSFRNYAGNDNPFKNLLFINKLIAYLVLNEQQICQAFGLKTKSENLAIQAEQQLQESRQREIIEKAGPEDLVDSGYGYSVKKKDLAKARRMGYDGIENL